MVWLGGGGGMVMSLGKWSGPEDWGGGGKVRS